MSDSNCPKKLPEDRKRTSGSFGKNNRKFFKIHRKVISFYIFSSGCLVSLIAVFVFICLLPSILSVLVRSETCDFSDFVRCPPKNANLRSCLFGFIR